MYVDDILKTSIIHEKMAKEPDFIDFSRFGRSKTSIFRA
jgi:hypothetical protein